METYWKILYTTQKHKKQTKKWIDGYMHVKPDGKNAVMYSEDLDKIHHFRIEQKFRCRITEGGEFGIQKYDLQVDEQLSKLPTDPSNPTGPSEFYSPPALVHHSDTLNYAFKPLLPPRSTKSSPLNNGYPQNGYGTPRPTSSRDDRKRKIGDQVQLPRFAPSNDDCFDLEKEDPEIKEAANRSKINPTPPHFHDRNTEVQPKKMKASPIPPPLFSANQISPPNFHDDDENQTASSEASTELSFNISEHGDSNTSYNSLPLFNTQGSLSESTTKPAKTSDIPDNASECSSIDPCTREESYDSLTRDKADPFSFKNPFESSDEE